MRVLAILAVGMVLSVWISPAFAFDRGEGGYFNNGNKLHDACKNDREYALGYVVGAYDMGQYMSLWERSDGLEPRFCSPANSTTGQYTDIVCNYLAEHPEVRTDSASSLMSAALREAWPCP